MAEFIPDVTITDLKKLRARDLKNLKCCEVYSDGEYLFTFMNCSLETSGYQRALCDSSGQDINAIGGETIETILGVVDAAV